MGANNKAGSSIKIYHATFNEQSAGERKTLKDIWIKIEIIYLKTRRNNSFHWSVKNT